MEKTYRGYPLAGIVELAVQDLNPGAVQGAEPYRLYNREEQMQWPGDWDDRRRMRSEHEYFRGLYPMDVRRWQRHVEEEFDRDDGPGSRIYDEYPDREWMYAMRNRIMRNAGDQGQIRNEDLVHILVLNEMLKRRAERPHMNWNNRPGRGQ